LNGEPTERTCENFEAEVVDAETTSYSRQKLSI
jgi:hypothetical protein